MLNGPCITVTVTLALPSLKRELQSDKVFQFHLVPWLLCDVYFFIIFGFHHHFSPSLLSQSNEGLIFGGLPFLSFLMLKQFLQGPNQVLDFREKTTRVTMADFPFEAQDRDFVCSRLELANQA